MTLGEIKKMSLRIIDRYAQNGKVLSKSNSNIQDYYFRMCDFINYAQVLISRQCPVVKTLDLGEPYEKVNNYSYYTLPANFMGLYYISSKIENAVNLDEISVIGSTIIIPCSIASDILIMYKSIPNFINDETNEDEILGIRPDLHIIIPLYVASNLLSIENPAKSVQLLNQFEVELSRLSDSDQISSSSVFSVNNW